MSQGDQFHQYGYDHYLKAPKRGGAYRQSPYEYSGGGTVSSLLYSLGSSVFLRKLQSPVMAGGVLAFALLLFVGVVVVTYSSDDSGSGAVPIVKADMGDIKYVPDNPGGMDIPYRQSTVLARDDQPSAEDQSRAVENLLASQNNEDLISKEEAFDRATQAPPMMGEDGVTFADSAEAQDDLAALHAQAEGAIDVVSAQEMAVSAVDNVSSLSSVEPAFEVEKPAADDILQKIGSSKDDTQRVGDSHSQEFIDMAAKAAVAEKPVTSVKTASVRAMASKPDPSSLHSAGQSPETIEYVRSVLEKDVYETGGVRMDGVDVRDIEPAVGAPAEDVVAPAPVLEEGAYFVQLASITDAKRAPGEWAKMQDKYSALASSRFRVQEAVLPGGKFYRIQAGPMSKGSANQICDALKQAGKPGGCLVVK